MKVTLVILCICLAIVHGDSISEGKEIVEKMAKDNATINDIFQPSIGGYLGKGHFGFTFAGIMLRPNLRPVAMKFTPNENAPAAVREYEMYTYLYAINNETVENFGIPAVYYYGRWEDYILMAITLLDSTIERSTESDGLIKSFDVFIMCAEFVRISKYIHCYGVRHNDIDINNMMFRKNQAFLIDFNIGRKMYKLDGTSNPIVEKSYAKDDWLSFLDAMLTFMGIEFEDADSDDIITGADILRENVTHTIEKIAGFEHEGLGTVFLEFAKHALEDEIAAEHLPNMSVNHDGTPFYDQVYQVIQAQMEGIRPGEQPLVSWLTDEERADASNYSVIPISSITDLFADPAASYPVVDPNIFYRMYHQ